MKDEVDRSPYRTGTLSEYIQDNADGENIEAIIFVGTPSAYIKLLAGIEFGKLYKWPDVEGRLNHKCWEYWSDSISLIAWTKSRVLFSVEYDGSRSIQWVTRDPSVDNFEISGVYCY